MSRQVIDYKARVIFEFERANLNQGFTREELAEATGLDLPNSSRTRTVFKRVQAMAEEAGLISPALCPQQGFKHFLADGSPEGVSLLVDPALQLGLIAGGVRAREDKHHDYAQANSANLSPEDRLLMNTINDVKQQFRALENGTQQLMKVVVGMRRKARQSGDE